LSVASNPSSALRTGSITISSGTFSQAININQDSTSSILLASPMALNYPWNGGMLNTSISSPSFWNATTSDSWFNINQNSGTGNFNLNVTCDTNFTALSRTGSINISNGVVTIVVTVQQDSNSVVSVVHYETGNINIYPNPAGEVIYIKLNNDKYSFTKGEIISISGQKIIDFKLDKTNDTEISLKQVLPGAYFIILSDLLGNKTYVKFIKE
jgi:hypothetical protein